MPDDPRPMRKRLAESTRQEMNLDHAESLRTLAIVEAIDAAATLIATAIDEHRYQITDISETIRGWSVTEADPNSDHTIAAEDGAARMRIGFD
jgi:hypothetical protein